MDQPSNKRSHPGDEGVGREGSAPKRDRTADLVREDLQPRVPRLKIVRLTTGPLCVSLGSGRSVRSDWS